MKCGGRQAYFGAAGAAHYCFFRDAASLLWCRRCGAVPGFLLIAPQFQGSSLLRDWLWLWKCGALQGLCRVAPHFCFFWDAVSLLWCRRCGTVPGFLLYAPHFQGSSLLRDWLRLWKCGALLKRDKFTPHYCFFRTRRACFSIFVSFSQIYSDFQVEFNFFSVWFYRFVTNLTACIVLSLFYTVSCSIIILSRTHRNSIS